jgi:hypothetical protein
MNQNLNNINQNIEHGMTVICKDNTFDSCPYEHPIKAKSYTVDEIMGEYITLFELSSMKAFNIDHFIVVNTINNRTCITELIINHIKTDVQEKADQKQGFTTAAKF